MQYPQLVNCTKEEAKNLAQFVEFAAYNKEDARRHSAAIQCAFELKDIPRVNLEVNPATTINGQTIQPAYSGDVGRAFKAPTGAPEMTAETKQQLEAQIKQSTVSLNVIDNGGIGLLGSGVMVTAPSQSENASTSNLMVTSVHNIADFLGISKGEDYIGRACRELKKMQGKDLNRTFLVNGEEVFLRVKAASNPEEGEQVLLEVRYADETRQKDSPFKLPALGMVNGSEVRKYSPENAEHYGVAGYSGKQQEFGIDPFVVVNQTGVTVTADADKVKKNYVNLADLSHADVVAGDSGGIFFRYRHDGAKWVVEHAGTITATQSKREENNRAWATLNSQSIISGVNVGQQRL